MPPSKRTISSLPKHLPRNISRLLGFKKLSAISRSSRSAGEVTTNSVYVVFPEMQTYVEVSADEGHALVGYRHFANAQALNDFLQRQGKAF